MAPRVWITRTLPEAEKTARVVEGLGYEALIQPVLEVRRLKPQWPDTIPDALVLTSHHALEALVGDGPFERLRHVRLFVVGETLKAKAAQYGFTGPIVAVPESQSLPPVIGDQIKPGAHILYLAPRDPATPLAAWLADKGFRVETGVVYETVPTHPDFAQRLTGDPLIILLHSPRAAFYLGQELSRQLRSGTNHVSRELALDVLTFICISEAVQNGLLAGLDLPDRSGVNCLIAERPDEVSLIRRLEDALNALK